MHQVNMKAELRAAAGKQACKKIRRDGYIPAIIYGRNFENVQIMVNARELAKVLTTGAGIRVIINLEVEKGSDKLEYKTMVSEVQKDVFQKRYLHVDFHRISLDEKVHAEVPIILTGEAKGIKTGGILDQILWRVPIEALPLDLPERMEVDISELSESESLTIADLPAPSGARFLMEQDEMVVIVHPPRVIEEVAAPVEAEAVPAEPQKATVGA